MKRWYNSSIISKATSVLSPLIAWLKPLRIEHVIVLGLDNAGKSTALYFLQKGAIASVSPTMRGGPHETYLYGRMQLTTWDASNSLSMFRRWLASFSSVSGLIFFLDAADTERMDEGLIALCQHLKEPQLADLPVLVLANKLDNNRALTTEQVADKVKTILAMERQWCVQGASIILRKGLDEGMQWLDKAIEEASNKRS